MIDYNKIFTEGGLERLKWLEDTLIFPPRYKLEFKLRDSSIESKTIIIKFIDTKPTVVTTVLLENSSQYNIINCVVCLF